jgi:hypothetical protein
MRTTRLAAVAVLALALTGYAAAATSTRSASIKGRVKWGSAFKPCRSPQRVGSVICISARGTSAALGKYEYSRDAVATGAQTSDGCPEFTTRGMIWIKGGKILFTGAPASTCGADPQQPGVSPDANYVVTLKSGSGRLKGATGTGTVLAARGTDIWAVTLTLRK